MTLRHARAAICFFAILLFPIAHAQQPTTNTATSSIAPPQPESAAYVETLHESYQSLTQGKLDDALDKANTTIQMDPKGLPGYVLRGSIYSEKKIYDKATQDFETALQIDGANATVKFNLAEVKFMQKDYAGARPGFAALQKDADLGDLAAYKVFLCDLFGGHADDAAKELDAFNQVGSNASYYFANAAWDLFNHKTEEARGWLVSAGNIYAPQKSSLYASSLRNLGYLPLPPPPPKN